MRFFYLQGRLGAVADPAAPQDLVFGMASLNEVEAIFVTAFVASIFAAWGVITQRVVAKRLKTIEHLASQEADKDMIAARREFNILSAPDGALGRYAVPTDLTPDQSNCVRLVLNDYELIAIGVHYQTIDYGIYKQFAKGRTIRDWTRAAPFVYKLRNEIDNPLIYYEFENLAQRLQENNRGKRRSWTRLIF